MQLLAGAVDDPGLAALYRGLLASEARHHETYVELARGLAPAAEVRGRLAELARHEAAVIAAAPPVPRMHT
jgi:tRNA-(ms[2]io[6]A)-hydroxylase